MAATTTCAGCGFEAAAVEGPTHAYIGASPACWSVFVRALVEKLGSVTAGPLLGDAYAVQHPGVSERRAVQSVGVHLVTLCAALDGGWSPRHLVDVRRRAAAAPEGFWTWLDADTPLGTMTIADVLAPEDPAARAELVPVLRRRRLAGLPRRA